MTIDNAARARIPGRLIAARRKRPTKDDAAVRRELNLYLDSIGRYLPAWFCRLVIWLRRPSRVLARIAISLLLVAGGLLSFLPVLGLWMLPLGLIILSQDLPVLQRPLLRAFRWTDRRWQRWRRPNTSV